MWWTAIIIGIAGSLHCVGMCSPLILAVTSTGPALVQKLLYNSGRIAVYGFYGWLVAWLGTAVSLTPFQGALSAGIGIVLILFALGGLSQFPIPIITSGIQRFSNFLKKQFGYFLRKKNNISLVAMGMVNGMLPCGLTYLALTYCVTLSTPLQGFLFMLLFGAGTLPVMLGLASLLSWIARATRINFQRITTIILFLMGGLLIGRAFWGSSHVHNPQAVKENEIKVCE